MWKTSFCGSTCANIASQISPVMTWTWSHEWMYLLPARFPEIAMILYYVEMLADPAALLRVPVELCRLSAPPQAALPPLEDDRTSAEPYPPLMLARLGGCTTRRYSPS